MELLICYLVFPREIAVCFNTLRSLPWYSISSYSFTSRIIEDDAGKVVKSEQRVDVRLRFEVVLVLAVMVVELCQQGGVGRLRKLGFFVHQRKDTQRFHCDHVESFLVVDELDAAPVNCLVVVFLLQSTMPRSTTTLT